MWSGATGFSDADISGEVLFGLGTQPDSTGLVPVPELDSGMLVGGGLIGLVWRGRRPKKMPVQRSPRLLA